ncbi:hypothetical protein HNP40_001675 [Mycobacteroides chelonae]|nr:hypothetical protein [Mycobacteroides chelonae]
MEHSLSWVDPRESGSAVAVGVDHSIADVRLYTDIVATGVIPDPPRQPIPDAPETAMARPSPP